MNTDNRSPKDEGHTAEPWFFEHQRRIKQFKNIENLHGECTQQVINEDWVKEEYSLTKGETGVPSLYLFTGSRKHGSTKVQYPSGREASITEIEASGIAPIQSNTIDYNCEY